MYRSSNTKWASGFEELDDTQLLREIIVNSTENSVGTIVKRDIESVIRSVSIFFHSANINWAST